MTNYLCIGVPYFIGEQVPHISAVADLRDSGIARELGATWIDLEPDFSAGDLPIVAVNRALAQTIAAHPDSVPLIFASDCVSALGAYRGLQPQQPDILWYDAHGDFNTPETTISGFLGGMPLAALVGRGNESLTQALGLQPVPETKVTLTDARNLDPAEAVLLAQSQVRHLRNLDDLLRVTWAGAPLYIHLDTDVVDSAEMPAMSYPETGGPSLEQTLATLRHVKQTARIAGVLFSLWNNTLPGAKLAQDATLRLVRTLV